MPDVLVVLALVGIEFINFLNKFIVIGSPLTHLHEYPHNRYINLNGYRTVKYRRKHGNTLFGEHVGWSASATPT